ncbi:MAG TPA: hypothetical protein VH599_15695 [Ktedonobacterales bacterium]|jgi:hypothetical protein
MRYLALAYSTIAVLIFLYGGYLIVLTPSVLFSAHVIGAILLVPAVAWWLVGLIHLAIKRHWGWLVGYVVLLVLAPMIYDMYQVRAAEANT